MEYPELRDQLYVAESEEEKTKGLLELDDLIDGLEKAVKDFKAANALLFAKYGSVADADELDEVEEATEDVEDIVEDIEDILEDDVVDEEEDMSDLLEEEE